MELADWTYGVICARCPDRWLTRTSSLGKLDTLTSLSFEEWSMNGCNLTYEDWLRNGFGSKRRDSSVDTKKYAQWLKEGFGSKRPISSISSDEGYFSYPNHEAHRIVAYINNRIPCLMCGNKQFLYDDYHQFEDGVLPYTPFQSEFCNVCRKTEYSRFLESVNSRIQLSCKKYITYRIVNSYGIPYSHVRNTRLIGKEIWSCCGGTNFNSSIDKDSYLCGNRATIHIKLVPPNSFYDGNSFSECGIVCKRCAEFYMRVPGSEIIDDLWTTFGQRYFW